MSSIVLVYVCNKMVYIVLYECRVSFLSLKCISQHMLYICISSEIQSYFINSIHRVNEISETERRKY
jgi:hypothetical protein